MNKRKSSVMCDWDQKSLASELTQGKEVAEKLMNQILHLSSSSQEETDLLLAKLLTSYEKALSLATSDVGSEEGESKQILMDSPSSFGNSSKPSSEISDQDCKSMNVFKKSRRTMHKRTKEVNVSCGTGQEGSLQDGFSWRKYGRKDILGANHPRGYYRCTHKTTQGCPATKQVQKSDADPTIFMITYTGEHTCHILPQLKGKQNVALKHEAVTPKQTPKRSFSFGLKVKTENLNTREDVKDIFPPFVFPSTPIESENKVLRDHIFAEMGNDFMCGNYAPTFGADYFGAVSPRHFGLVANYVQTSESDLTHEILSASNSVANSPMEDFGFSLEDLDFYSLENNQECSFL